jgi:hypothetical protein
MLFLNFCDTNVQNCWEMWVGYPKWVHFKLSHFLEGCQPSQRYFELKVTNKGWQP